MARSAPASRLTISVDSDLRTAVVGAAKDDQKILSACMTAAARRRLLITRGLAAVAEWEDEHGALTLKERRAARARVRASRPTVRRPPGPTSSGSSRRGSAP